MYIKNNNYLKLNKPANSMHAILFSFILGKPLDVTLNVVVADILGIDNMVSIIFHEINHFCSSTSVTCFDFELNEFAQQEYF